MLLMCIYTPGLRVVCTCVSDVVHTHVWRYLAEVIGVKGSPTRDTAQLAPRDLAPTPVRANIIY